MDWALLFKWLKSEKYISDLREFRRLTLCQINLFVRTSKSIDQTKKLNKQLNANLKKSKAR